MGVEDLAKTIIDKFKHLPESVPDEAVAHNEPVDCYFDFMTRLMSTCKMLADQYPGGVTTRMVYERLMIPIREIINTRQYDVTNSHVHLFVCCFDKQIFVPSRKAALQAKRNANAQQQNKKDTKDETKDIPILKHQNLYRFDDNGMYSVLARMFSEDEPHPEAESRLFNPFSVMLSRPVRLEMYRHFWRMMQSDVTLWPVDIPQAFLTQPVVWGPCMRFVVDFEPHQAARVMDISCTGERTFSRYPKPNLIGEGENQVIWHLLRNWAERKATRISIFTTDQDMCAMLMMHFWFYDLSHLKTFLWHRRDYKIHVAFHIPHVIQAFRSTGWTRPRFAALCTLLGSDYADRVTAPNGKVLGTNYSVDACFAVNAEASKLQMGEEVKIPDEYTPLSMSQFSVVVLKLLRCKWPKLSSEEINLLVKEHARRLHDDYVWQTTYWFNLYEP